MFANIILIDRKTLFLHPKFIGPVFNACATERPSERSSGWAVRTGKKGMIELASDNWPRSSMSARLNAVRTGIE